MDLISIITVNFNQHQATLELLKSIHQYYHRANIEIILVDNGSNYSDEYFYRTPFPAVIYIKSLKNLGFAGGNNLGVKAAKGNYLFFVNNDTEFTSGVLEQLIAPIVANPKIGMVSPQLNYFDNKSIVQYAGFTNMDYFTCRNVCIGQFEEDLGQYANQLKPTGYGHGAAMMVSRQALDKAGLMAENYFLYYEELDWGDRIKKAGFEIWINTNALIYHKESLAVGKNSELKEFFMNRNRILFIRRNATLVQRWCFYLYFLLLVAPRNILNYIKSGHRSFIPVLFNAILWNIKNKTTSKDLGYKLK